MSELKPIVEAMIFVAEEPITEAELHAALATEGAELAQIRECVASIEADWNGDAARGIGLIRVAGGLQFRTKQALAEHLRRLSIPKPARLSGPALETLSIVAYRQPIMRSEIERIRGVDSGAVLKTLLERRLLRIVGRSQEPGQPLLYGTTREFLELFNLSALTELPTLKDIDDLLRERRNQAQGDAPRPAVRAEDDEEELTDVIGEEGEEETEIIRRKPLDEDEEEERKDMEALSELEGQLKDLRRLERHIFPKPEPAEGGTPQEGPTDEIHGAASETVPAEAPPVAEAGAGGADGADGDPAADAPAAPDRPFE